MVEDVEILVAVKFCSMPFSGFRGKVEHISDNQRPGGHLVFPISPKNINFVKDVACILSSFVEFHSEANSKMWKINDGRTTDNAYMYTKIKRGGGGSVGLLKTHIIFCLSYHITSQFEPTLNYAPSYGSINHYLRIVFNNFVFYRGIIWFGAVHTL